MTKYKLLISIGLLGLAGHGYAADEERGDRRIEALDRNGDGNIDFEEFQNTGSRGFAALDSDSDGAISLEEFLGAGEGRARRGSPELTPERNEERRARMLERAEQRFREMDQDGDDRISLPEFQETLFRSRDRNADGVLNGRELRPRPGRPGRRGSAGRSDDGGGQSGN